MNFNELKNKKIVIGGWVSPVTDRLKKQKVSTEDSYKNLKECGFDFIHTLYENSHDNEIIDALDNLEKQNIFGYIYDSRINDINYDKDARYNLIKEFRKRKSFAGLNLADEPGINKFETLNNLVSEYKDIDCYINFLPMYATYNQLKTAIWKNERQANKEEYIEYLNEIDKIKLNEFSYDFYPFDSDYGVIKENYFLELYLTKMYADKRGIPLWDFIQITAFKNEIRVISEEEIYFLINTSLCFGVTGIQYFTYFCPINNEYESFRGAIVDMDGTLTDRYYLVKSANEFINSLGDKLVNARFLGVDSNGYVSDLIPCEAKKNNDIKVNGQDYLCGLFTKNNKRVWLLMNTSFEGVRKYSIDANGLNIKLLNSDEKLNEITLDKGRSILIYEE